MCVTKKEGRLPKVDRDRHRESSHLPDLSDTFAQTERTRTYTQQRHNTADDLFPSFQVGSHTTAAEPTRRTSADATSIHTKDTENTSQTKIHGFVFHIKSPTAQAFILPFFPKTKSPFQWHWSSTSTKHYQIQKRDVSSH